MQITRAKLSGPSNGPSGVCQMRPAKQFKATPGFSVCHMALAAPLAKLGRFEEAGAAAARVLELQPTFGYARQLKNVGAVPSFAADFGEALRAAGLPE